MAKRAQMPLGKKKMNAKDSVKRKPANSNESPVVKKVKPMSQSSPRSGAPKQQNSEEACTETLSKNKENSPPLKLTRRSTSEAAIKAAAIKAAALEAAAATAATSPSPKKDKAEGEQGWEQVDTSNVKSPDLNLKKVYRLDADNPKLLH